MQFGAFIRMITGAHNLFEEMKLFHKYAETAWRFSCFLLFVFFLLVQH